MKNKIVLLFLFSFLIPIHFSFAFSQFDLGGKYNPINVQIQPDPNATQKIANTQKENYLKSTYGVSSYYKCSSTPAYASYCGPTANMADTFTVTSCLGWIQYCLERQTIQQQTNSQPIQQKGTLCNGNYWNACPVGDNFVCPSTGSAYCETPKTNELIRLSGCISGQGYSSTTGISCDGANRCAIGSQFNSDKTKCVVIPSVPAKTNDQICADSYGLNSKGVLDDQSKLTCDCKTGYQWNQGQTQCSLIPKTKTVKIITPIAKKVSEVKTVQAEVKKDTSTTNTTNLTATNSDTKVITSTEPIKPKNFWTRFLGWLGF